jgi:hypothetical protein
MWRFAILSLVACTEHGQLPPGGDAPTPVETPLFAPTVCTGGEPDAPGLPNPNCLVNRISLEGGSEAIFTVQVLGSSVVFPDLTFLAGQAGLVIVNPKVVIGGVATGPSIVVDLEAGAAQTLPSFAVVGAQVISGMALRFDAIGPQD